MNAITELKLLWHRTSRLAHATLSIVLVLCVTSVLGILLSGCQETKPEFSEVSPEAAGEPASVVEPTAANTATRLHEGDAVKLQFQGDTNMNKVVKVQLDGTINMEFIGDVHAAGKTTLELQSELKQRYEPLLKDSTVTVTIVNSGARVYVSGAVLKPGPVAMERPMTVMEAIMEAGGFDLKKAKLSSVKVLRVEDGQQKRYEVNLKKVLEGEETTTFYLKPYDVVHVPEKIFNL